MGNEPPLELPEDTDMHYHVLSSAILAIALIGCNHGTKGDSASSSTGDSGSVNTADTAPSTQADQDGDTILDVSEGTGDVDGDGTANDQDVDADGDTILDGVEAGDADPLTLPVDSDGDGTPDYLDLDSDNNCIPDAVEAGRTDGHAIDSDGDGAADYADPDNDGDGISDVYEVGSSCSTPADTDHDGIPDYMDVDSDGDGIGDRFEAGTTPADDHPADHDGDGIPDFQDTDSDGDGLPDSAESGVTDPTATPRDTDGDGLYDFADTDSDNDGLTDQDEVKTGTDPYDSDSDGDGFSDGAEALAGTDPLDAGSVIDGVYVDVEERTAVEHDFVFDLQIDQGDVAVICDTTCSMSGTISAVQKAYVKAIEDIGATIPDMAGGAAQHDDYAYGSFGSPGVDKPFWLSTGITTDLAAVQTAVNNYHLDGGSDGPEASMEALYQGASGEGYDQNCNGSYDDLTDIPPFLATLTDPFGGAGGENYDPSLPGAGLRGGFGFRKYSLPVIALATDAYMRDPDSTNTMYNEVPGGCPLDAGETEVASAFLDLGAYFVGVDVSGAPTPQMNQIAADTNSYADMDGDGVLDPLVYRLDPTSPTYVTDFSDYLTLAVTQLVATIKFTSVNLEIQGDTYGFVTAVIPDQYTDIDPSTTSSLTFTLQFRGVVAATKEDQLFLLTMNILGDGTTLLGTKDIVIRVPGHS